MAELADAADSKSADLRVLGVRLPLPAPTFPVGSEVPTVHCPLLRGTLLRHNCDRRYETASPQARTPLSHQAWSYEAEKALAAQ